VNHSERRARREGEVKGSRGSGRVKRSLSKGTRTLSFKEGCASQVSAVRRKGYKIGLRREKKKL